MARAPLRTLRTVLPLLAVLLATAVLGQTTRITGTVRDAVTGETLPFVNVAFVDSRIGASTDIDGRYVLDTYYPTDSIRVISVGYRPFVARVKKDVEQVVDVALQPATDELVELVIRPTENSAFSVLRRVVANKRVNNREKLSAYQFETYNKIEFDLNNITEEFTKKKLFKDFDFIFDHIDSTDGKPYLPIFMTESLSDVYYRQKPRTRREVIKGTKVSGVENESIRQFMGDMYQNVNIYDNFLVIFGKNFVSPIADGGRGYYKYLLKDSVWVGRNWCYHIEFKPKRPQELAFTGEMWISDTTYAVRKVRATIGEGMNLNFVQALEVEQEYEEVEREVWMLTNDRLVVDINVVKDKGKDADKKGSVQGFYGRRTATYRDFVIGRPMDDAFFSGADEVVVDIDPLSLGADYWDTHRHVQLTAKEAGIYHMVDTMKTIPRFRTYVDIVTTVVTGYYTKGKIDIGPYFTTYSFNPVEGHRFRLGARTSTNFSKRVEFEGHVAYGTNDGQFKFGLGGQAFTSSRRREILGLYYKRDIEQLGQSVNAFRQDNILSSAFRRNPNTKLTLVEEYKATLEREWFTGFSNTGMLRYRNLYPRGDLAYIANTGPDGPVSYSNIRTAEVSLNTRFAFREKFVSGDFRRLSLGTRYPTLELHAAWGLKDRISDHGYRKLVAHVYQRVPMGALGWLRINAEAGRVWGDLPYPLLVVHSGNETFYLDDAAFNTMNFFEFISDRYAQLFLEHHFEGLLFNRIPLMRRLKWREVFTAKAVLGDLDLARHERVMSLMPGMYRLDDGPFVEVSAGVENILKVLRVDGIWRLRYTHHADTAGFVLRLKLFINF